MEHGPRQPKPGIRYQPCNELASKGVRAEIWKDVGREHPRQINEQKKYIVHDGASG
jgi:hypothetical protein